MTNRFGIGSLGLGSLGNMLESVDLVKKAWSSFNLPSSLAPTMDIDELDKRIADLKAVEQWLNVNLSMLHGTIQGMEIQRGTLAAIKAFGQAVAPHAEGFAGMAGAAAAAAARAAQSGVASAKAARDEAARTEPPPEPPPAGRQATDLDTAGQPAEETSMAADLSRAAAAAVNPATWWNLLQSQFNQVAQAAMSGPGLGSPAASQGASSERSPRRAKAPSKAAKAEPTGAPQAAPKSRASGAGAGSARKAAARAPRKKAT